MYDYTNAANKPKYCAACKHAELDGNGKALCTSKGSTRLAFVPLACRDFNSKHED